LRADPENVDHIGHWLSPDDPPGRFVRHLDRDYPAVRPVTQALAADLARVTAQPFQHALDPLAILAAVFARCTIGLQGTWNQWPCRWFLSSRRRIRGGSRRCSEDPAQAGLHLGRARRGANAPPKGLVIPARASSGYLGDRYPPGRARPQRSPVTREGRLAERRPATLRLSVEGLFGW
jgi:hypothetical protein